MRVVPINKGDVLASVSSASTGPRMSKLITCELDLFTKSQGGRDSSVQSGLRPQIYIGNVEVTGTMQLAPGVKEINPGSKKNLVRFELNESVPVRANQNFGIREGGRTLGRGIVKEVN